MDHRAEIAQCDKIIAELAKLFAASDTRHALEFAKETYKSEGRGFLTYFFESIDEAREFIRNIKDSGKVTTRVNYLNSSDAKDLDYPILTQFVDEYNPQDSHVVLISINFKDGTKNCRGRMRAIIVKTKF